MSPATSLSVVVVTPSDFAHVRLTVRGLRRQDAVGEIELVLVAPSEAAVADRLPAELEAFGSTQIVSVGPILNVDRAAARGVLAATSEIVAVIEDHAFVAPGWARALIDAYDDPRWVSVGSVLENANPGSGLSWANLLLGYGWWIDPARASAMHDVPSHNGSYRRAALVALADDLPALMVRQGGLHDRLRASGGEMLLAGGARIAHLNPSRLSSTAALRFNAGRLYGHERRTAGGWSVARRAAYAAGAPLIPLVRLRRLHAEHLARGRSHHHLARRILPGLVVALALDAAGQAAGYVRGPGAAAERTAVFEMDRVQHLRPGERRRLRAEAER